MTDPVCRWGIGLPDVRHATQMTERAIAAAESTSRSESPQAFSAERQLHGPHNPHFVGNARAAAVLTGPTGVAPHFVLFDPHRIELFESLDIGITSPQRLFKPPC